MYFLKRLYHFNESFLRFSLTVTPSCLKIVEDSASRGISTSAIRKYSNTAPQPLLQTVKYGTVFVNRRSLFHSPKPIEMECPVLEGVKYTTYSSLPYDKFEEEISYNAKINSKCKILSAREDKKALIKLIMMMSIEYLKDQFPDLYTLKQMHQNRFFVIDNDLKNPSLWHWIVKHTKTEESHQLKRKLREAKIAECQLCVAIARLYAYLDDQVDVYHSVETYSARDVEDVLKVAGLNELDLKSIQILFAVSRTFERVRF